MRQLYGLSFGLPRCKNWPVPLRRRVCINRWSQLVTSIDWAEANLCVERSLLAFKLGRDIVTEEMIFSLSELDRHQANTQFVGNFRPRWFVATTLAGAGPCSVILKIQRWAEASPFPSVRSTICVESGHAFKRRAIRRYASPLLITIHCWKHFRYLGMGHCCWT
jgi:hypothetical protein